MIHIDHPNIARVREVQLEGSTFYVVMDFVEGGDLRSLLREEGLLDIPTTLRLGLQITAAFQAIHTRHIKHRGISPETILYHKLASGEYHILLTDFGIADLRTDDTLTSQSFKPYEYKAPEQFGDSQHVNEAVDYYALGVVLYECLTGKVPFVLHNETSLDQLLTTPMPEFKTAFGQPLPPSLVTLLMCLLSRNPQDRLRNAGQLELLLEQSRVEYLNASWSVSNTSMKKTTANPVEIIGDGTGAIDDSTANGQTRQTVSGIGRWWLEICIILAAGLAIGLYSRIIHPLANDSTFDRDSISGKTPPNKKRVTKSAELIPISSEEKEVTPENDMKSDTGSQVIAEPVTQPKPLTDSTAHGRAVSDSAIVISPDSIP